MLHPFDEHPLHQAAVPLLQPVTGDPNVYDRYFFHGYEADTGLIFVVALGLYPNRQIIDAAFCVSVDGHQRSVFASGRADRDRTTRVGPIAVEVVDPMRTLRVTVDAADQGLSADLTFRARSAAIEEPRQTMMDRTRLIMDTCRYTQFGRWVGDLSTGGVAVQVDPVAFAGTRDRSWGTRPLSGAVPTAPATQPGGIFWSWSPLQFDDGCLHLARSDDPDGRATLQTAVFAADVGDRAPWDADETLEHGRGTAFEVDWVAGRRLPERTRAQVDRVAGQPPVCLELDPVGRVHMRGAGYTHLERGHGAWHGELDVATEELRHDEVDPWDLTGLHVHQVVRVSGDRSGIGVFELLALGPHAPSGLTGFVDPP